MANSVREENKPDVEPLSMQANLETFTFNNVEYGIVKDVNNSIWLDRNLGASQIATAKDDADSYGDMYQWGRRTDGHEKRDSASTTDLVGAGLTIAPDGKFIKGSSDWLTDQNDTLWNSIGTGANEVCPSGYHVPSEAEWTT